MKTPAQIIRPRRPRRATPTRRAGVRPAAPTATDVPTPFRWDITARPELGTLLDGEAATAAKNFLPRLMRGGARVVALADDSDLVFIGRSPESLFDLLTGLFSETSWRGRLTLLHFSSGYFGEFEKSRRTGPALSALRAYMDSLRLSPAKIIVRERPVTLIDLICSGGTFHQFLLILRQWAADEGADWPAVRRKIRVVGIIRDGKDRETPRWRRRYHTLSWRDENPWLGEGELLDAGALHEVGIEGDLWDFLGDEQEKTTRSYGPCAWGDPEYATPYRNEGALRALRFARRLFEQGGKPATREAFAALLCREPALRTAWLRRLAREIRAGAAA